VNVQIGGWREDRESEARKCQGWIRHFPCCDRKHQCQGITEQDPSSNTYETGGYAGHRDIRFASAARLRISKCHDEIPIRGQTEQRQRDHDQAQNDERRSRNSAPPA